MRDGIRRRKSRGDKKEKEKEKMNGEPIEKILDRMEDHNLRIEAKVDKINEHGCAHRMDDLRRIETVEDAIRAFGNKMDRLFYASLATALGIIAFLIKALWPYIVKL